MYHHLILFFAFACALYRAVVSIRLHLYHRREARRLNCLPSYHTHTRLFLGIDLVYRALAADRAQRFPRMIAERFPSASVSTLKQYIFGTTSFLTRDPENIKALLATQFHDFGLGSMRTGNFWPLLGPGIFTFNGRAWEHARALLRPQFAREQVADLELEEEHVRHFINVLPKPGSDGWTEVVDLQPLFFRLTLDSATEFLFGESVNSQLSKGDFDSARDSHQFAINFDMSQGYLASRSRFQSGYFLLDSLAFRRAIRKTHEYVDRFVRKALNQSKASTDEESMSTKKPKYVFLEALAKSTQDPLLLRSNIIHILLAGRDTTASLLSWTFYELARHPEIYARLRAEVMQHFGVLSESITFSSLKSCAYLQHVLMESLRMYPVVPVNSRQALCDTTLPRGGGADGLSPVYITKGTVIVYSVYAMHHDAAIWGPEVEEFKPERWQGRKRGWEYLPFNGGPRICLGQQFALTEAAYVVVRLAQKIEEMQVPKTKEEEVPKLRSRLTMCPGDGVHVRFKETKIGN